MSELIGTAVCLWLLFRYFCYMKDVQEWKRKQRYPQATKRESKPQFLNIKKSKNGNKSKKNIAQQHHKG
jgi:hypothetical protein